MNSESAIELQSGESIYPLHIPGLRIIQSKDRFMFGIDAVLLADFSKVKKGEEVVELGTGTGIIPLLVAAKNDVKKITAFEIQKVSADMAERSVALNKMENKIQIVNENLENIRNVLPAQSVNVVISNPPYMKQAGADVNSLREIAIARHEIMCTLESVVEAASYVLKPNGRFYMIHKPQRLSEIITEGVKNNLEVKKLRFVVPEAGKSPTMVLVEYVKCASSGMEVESDLIVYKEKGVYSQEVERIYGR
nr:tRNA1(Val) (adenine(37)-N6)-methyltransferase [uncultured Treponema sp.]